VAEDRENAADELQINESDTVIQESRNEMQLTATRRISAIRQHSETSRQSLSVKTVGTYSVTVKQQKPESPSVEVALTTSLVTFYSCDSEL